MWPETILSVSPLCLSVESSYTVPARSTSMINTTAPEGNKHSLLPVCLLSLGERETLHLFQPPRADQMPDPSWGQCHNVCPDNL